MLFLFTFLVFRYGSLALKPFNPAWGFWYVYQVDLRIEEGTEEDEQRRVKAKQIVGAAYRNSSSGMWHIQSSEESWANIQFSYFD